MTEVLIGNYQTAAFMRHERKQGELCHCSWQREAVPRK